ncbi:MAG: hypothetical protein MUE83_06795 [Tabrizicola sp.]|jgi:hypothetical protein|nr:hypothetical protein [Tabrizicola sp.]
MLVAHEVPLQWKEANCRRRLPDDQTSAGRRVLDEFIFGTDRLEALLRLRFIGVQIGSVLARKLLIGLLDLLGRRYLGAPSTALGSLGICPTSAASTVRNRSVRQHSHFRYLTLCKGLSLIQVNISYSSQD